MPGCAVGLWALDSAHRIPVAPLTGDGTQRCQFDFRVYCQRSQLLPVCGGVAPVGLSLLRLSEDRLDIWQPCGGWRWSQKTGQYDKL